MRAPANSQAWCKDASKEIGGMAGGGQCTRKKGLAATLAGTLAATVVQQWLSATSAPEGNTLHSTLHPQTLLTPSYSQRLRTSSSFGNSNRNVFEFLPLFPLAPILIHFSSSFLGRSCFPTLSAPSRETTQGCLYLYLCVCMCTYIIYTYVHIHMSHTHKTYLYLITYVHELIYDKNMSFV